MSDIACARRNRFSLILFFAFSVLFISSGIPDVYRESMLHGSGYFQSWTLLKKLLTFVPFILCTVYIYLLIRRRYVLVFNKAGIMDQRYAWGKLFVPWDAVFSAEIRKEGKWYCLLLRFKSKAYDDQAESTNPVGETLKISLKGIDCDLQQIENYIKAMKNK